jgi:hypothetical protein
VIVFSLLFLSGNVESRYRFHLKHYGLNKPKKTNKQTKTKTGLKHFQKHLKYALIEIQRRPKRPIMHP